MPAHLKLCANYDTDPDVSGCATPYDGVSMIYPSVPPRAPVLLCRACFTERMARDRTVQTGVCHGCHAPLYGGGSHPQCSGFPLD